MYLDYSTDPALWLLINVFLAVINGFLYTVQSRRGNFYYKTVQYIFITIIYTVLASLFITGIYLAPAVLGFTFCTFTSVPVLSLQSNAVYTHTEYFQLNENKLTDLPIHAIQCRLRNLLLCQLHSDSHSRHSLEYRYNTDAAAVWLTVFWPTPSFFQLKDVGQEAANRATHVANVCVLLRNWTKFI